VSTLTLSPQDACGDCDIEELLEYRAMIEASGGLDAWVNTATEESLHAYAVVIWDAYYAAVLRPAGH
jgi:hypothetical protein